MIRADARAAMWRWREVAFAVAVVGLGLWLVGLGGWVLWPLGASLVAVGLASGLVALRRLRFLREVEAPGVVEVDEGQVGYLGPSFGGYVSLTELSELRLVRLHGLAHWRLKQADGQTLLIPIAASGADKLYDAFAVLPGVDMAAVTQALAQDSDAQTLWRRSGALAKSAPADHELS